jgi:hypothetical protein
MTSFQAPTLARAGDAGQLLMLDELCGEDYWRAGVG